jgi:hypothetical protein
LSSNPLGPFAVQALAEELPRTKLRKLALNQTSLDGDGFCALCVVLPDCTDLECLSLNGNSLGDECLSFFTSVVNRCPKLKSVSLEGNRFCDIRSLSARLVFNRTVERLSFARNATISDEHVLAFVASTLKSHSSLQHANFSGTGASSATLALVKVTLEELSRNRALVRG